ncbi:S8 family serine peptidase, partial [Chloroflexota bacterium]
GGDPSIIVAVLDSGVAYETYGEYIQAPDLASTNFWVNSDEIPDNSIDDDGNGYVDDINGWDFANGDAHPNDNNGHGTHVCGTIAQSTNNGLGVAGIAFNTTIMPVKVGNIEGPTNMWLSEGIYYATNNGAHIINISASSEYSITLENAVAYAYNSGVTIVCAAGNEYEEGNSPSYPAAYDDYCIAVGATRYDQTHAPYSNTGPYIDIVAPGGDLAVDQNGDGYKDGILQNTFNTNTHDVTDFGYPFLQGTSMACPHVAGVAALILAKNPSLTPDQVRQALESTATDLGDPGWDEVYGWGLVTAASDMIPPTMKPINEPQGRYYDKALCYCDYALEKAFTQHWYKV